MWMYIYYWPFKSFLPPLASECLLPKPEKFHIWIAMALAALVPESLKQVFLITKSITYMLREGSEKVTNSVLEWDINFQNNE